MVKYFAQFLLGCLLISSAPQGYSQDRFIDKNGTVIFEASEKLFEEVKGTNTTVTAVLDANTNQMASLALITGFQFKNSLMQEHFNENYAESERYPKATFKGELVDFDVASIGSEITQVAVRGTLSFHGKSKEVETMAKVQKVDDVLALHGSFSTTPSDFDIEIPRIVRNKIAKQVLVKFDFKLKRKP